MTSSRSSGVPLVSGYDSDSGSEGETSAPVKPPGLSSLLPPPSSSSNGPRLESVPSLSSSSSNGNTKSSQKRRPEKRQIRIDALETLQRDEDENGEEEEEEEERKKRSKVGSNGTSTKSGLYGLLGILPAPQNKEPSTAVKETDKAKEGANSMGISGSSEGRLQVDASQTDVKKAKGNADFRAMLGLKPSTLPAKSKEKSKVVVSPAAQKAQSVEKAEEAPIRVKEDDQPSLSTSTSTEFFSFSASSSSGPQERKSQASFQVSTAPVVEEEADAAAIETIPEEDQYKGWQQGPDGNWFPVTPEAHAAYNAYQSSQAAVDDRFAERPADMQYSDINSINSVDANAGREAWQNRPSSEIDASAVGLDRKYAMAAASVAIPDQGIPLVDFEEELKKMDKKTNFRARKKGQLSALIAQAEENREKLEERWSRGKEGKNAAREKYGF